VFNRNKIKKIVGIFIFFYKKKRLAAVPSDAKSSNICKNMFANSGGCEPPQKAT
jgi:hypothetical protein